MTIKNSSNSLNLVLAEETWRNTNNRVASENKLGQVAEVDKDLVWKNGNLIIL